MLKPGDIAPAFSLANDSGQVVSSAQLKGQRYVLYFYPKDDTPGCTKEACAFRDNLPAFGKLGVPVYGLSADDGKSHAKFVKKYALNFPLLSDPDHALLDKYGAWVEKNMYGRTYFGVQRSTFVIGANGRIEFAWPKVSVNGHAEEVLAMLKGGAAPATQDASRLALKKAPASKRPARKAAGKPTSTKATAAKPAAKKAATRKTPAKAAKPAAKPVAKKAVKKTAKPAARSPVRKAKATTRR